MKLSDELAARLKEHLNWGKPRVDCFVSMLVALFCVQQMNLARLAVAMGGDADIESRYRRLQRFFQQVRFDYDRMARLIMQLFAFGSKVYYLTVDRTNWKWGKINRNILTLAVVYKGVAIPVFWLILNKKGNSNQRERIALLQRFISCFGSGQIQGILGDREFIGETWWGWLKLRNIPFLMRMKENQLYKDKRGRERSVRRLFRKLKRGELWILPKPQWISGQSVWLSGLRLESGELLILASNQRFSQPFDVYAKRWEIENLFQCLKGRGFNMEATHLTHYFRIKKMMSLMALGFCWAHKTGEWKSKVVKPLKIKNHGRPERGLFRYGLDYLADKLFSGCVQGQEACRLLLLFFCPPDWIICDDVGIRLIDFEGSPSGRR